MIKEVIFPTNLTDAIATLTKVKRLTNELSTKDVRIKKLEQRVDQLEESAENTEYSCHPKLRDHASSTCGGQNRYRNLAALLMYAMQTTQVETINFLESGHSYMECDSIIESQKKYVDVYTMID